jgi:hypothetical protein
MEFFMKYFRIIAIILIVMAYNFAFAQKNQFEFFGLKLGDSKEKIHERMKEIKAVKNEEVKTQEFEQFKGGKYLNNENLIWHFTYYKNICIKIDLTIEKPKPLDYESIKQTFFKKYKEPKEKIETMNQNFFSWEFTDKPKKEKIKIDLNLLFPDKEHLEITQVTITNKTQEELKNKK